MSESTTRDVPALKSLPFVLSVIAGSMDVIGFLGLNGLFTAHITGNLVVLAAHVVIGSDARLAPIISVPVFIAALAATKFFAAGLERARIAPLPVLLLLQLLLILGFLAVCFFEGVHAGLDTPSMVVAGMLGVSAMAVQNALVRIALPGAPATAVLTTNITLFTLDLVELLIGGDTQRVAQARERSSRTWLAIAGFLVGCVVGAACESAVGLNALALPTGLALAALLLVLVANSRPASAQGTPRLI